MKTSNHFLKVSGFLKTIPLLLLTIIIGCSKQDMMPENSGENLNMSDSKSLIVHEGTINLQGYTRFAFYATKEGKVITDGYSMNFLECQAELIFGENQDFVLNTTEVVPGIELLYREMSIKGKITPSGQLEFSWPETWMELNETGVLEPRTGILAQVRFHTGMAISGQSINKNTLTYMGSFDGEKLFADMHIVGLQEVPGSMAFFTEMVDGPVKINYMFDLAVIK